MEERNQALKSQQEETLEVGESQVEISQLYLGNNVGRIVQQGRILTDLPVRMGADTKTPFWEVGRYGSGPSSWHRRCANPMTREILLVLTAPPELDASTLQLLCGM